MEEGSKEMRRKKEKEKECDAVRASERGNGTKSGVLMEMGPKCPFQYEGSDPIRSHHLHSILLGTPSVALQLQYASFDHRFSSLCRIFNVRSSSS
ncbi:unnamed protein product [Prunus armeniaca]|uniref:Uncharacterized protein n=1 Tax=Prunus armeniaca TaxID=36596 RepID=A0A6J5VLA5_PRUAR|nr:unnamed protein product [Prunus armeniaca]CAB4319296.1 unnamed protein product [Prunus armeniaca]